MLLIGDLGQQYTSRWSQSCSVPTWGRLFESASRTQRAERLVRIQCHKLVSLQKHGTSCRFHSVLCVAMQNIDGTIGRILPRRVKEYVNNAVKQGTDSTFTKTLTRTLGKVRRQLSAAICQQRSCDSRTCL
jgi:hypothetical protein